MDGLKPELLPLFQYLLPGFVAAWIFHRLIAAPRPSPLDAIVQALIFTTLIQAAVTTVKLISLQAGRFFAITAWTHEIHLLWSFVIALIFGALAVRCVRSDRFLFAHLRRWRLTSQMSYPNEWYSGFAGSPGFIILQLRDDKRVSGWATEWTSDPEKGHIRLEWWYWIDDDKAAAVIASCPLDPRIQTESSILLNVADIRWVEFYPTPDEVKNEYQATDTITRHPEIRQVQG